MEVIEDMLRGICILWYVIIMLLAFVSGTKEFLIEAISLLWLGVLICNLSDIEDKG